MDFQHQNLRLRVKTNNNLHIMCSVPKKWLVHKLYSHLEKLYAEVTEDHGLQQRNIIITKMKRDEYYIPKSQEVGAIFSDLDQIQCTVIERDGRNPHASKKEKKKNKRVEDLPPHLKDIIKKQAQQKQPKEQKTNHKKEHEKKHSDQKGNSTQKKKQETKKKDKSEKKEGKKQMKAEDINDLKKLLIKSPKAELKSPKIIPKDEEESPDIIDEGSSSNL